MKNGLIIWNVVLTLAVGFLAIKHFGKTRGHAGTTAKPGLTDSSGDYSGQFRMAYFEMDSVAAKFEMVKDLKNELTKKEDAINSEMTNRAQALQQKYEYYQKKAQAGQLTQEQMDAGSKEMKEIDEANKNRKQELDQDYNNYMMKKQNEIKSEIEAFIKEYNKTKNYSYVVSDDPGLFYFQDTAYNITADVIKGLNEIYKNKSKK